MWTGSWRALNKDDEADPDVSCTHHLMVAYPGQGFSGAVRLVIASTDLHCAMADSTSLVSSRTWLATYGFLLFFTTNFSLQAAAVMPCCFL